AVVAGPDTPLAPTISGSGVGVGWPYSRAAARGSRGAPCRSPVERGRLDLAELAFDGAFLRVALAFGLCAVAGGKAAVRAGLAAVDGRADFLQRLREVLEVAPYGIHIVALQRLTGSLDLAVDLGLQLGGHLVR